jgi:hypothetical protein
MFDSIHTGRWLSQFTDQDIDFILFPSKKFKKMHRSLENLLENRAGSTFKIAHPIKVRKVLGYLDFFAFVLGARIFRKNFRALFLRKTIAGSKFDFVHALEIQGAGYLCDEAIKEKHFKLIITNWGSDIFYFQHLEEHLPRIKSVLAKADFYSAECMRDYKLALNLGFRGEQLPCIPNGGGLVSNEQSELGLPPPSRNNIVVKTYGGIFGRGELAIDAVAEAMKEDPKLTAYFYSVTEDLLEQVIAIKNAFKERISYSTLKKPISHEQLEEIFGISKIYIGCSISDGISTSFLEALVKGVYPIQTNTSCANEWVEKGAIASLVPLDSHHISKTLLSLIKDPEYIETAVNVNFLVACQELSKLKIMKIASEFYNIKV